MIVMLAAMKAFLFDKLWPVWVPVIQAESQESILGAETC